MQRSGGVEGTPGVRHRIIEAGAGPLSIYEAGHPDGAAVLLLHGAMFDEARFAWDQLFPELAMRWRVIALDTPRHGRSRPWTGKLDRPRLMTILESALDALELERLALVGLSMGGGLAIELAARNPERVQAMALFEPGGIGTRLPHQLLTWLYLAVPGTDRLAGARLARRTRAGLRRQLEALFVGGSSPTDPERLTDILADEIAGKARWREPDLDDWQRSAIGPARLRWNLLELIPRIACPTLWLRGAESTLVSQAEMDRAAALADRPEAPAGLVVVPGAGHLLPLERPARANAAVVDFLRDRLDDSVRGRALPE